MDWKGFPPANQSAGDERMQSRPQSLFNSTEITIVVTGVDDLHRTSAHSHESLGLPLGGAFPARGRSCEERAGGKRRALAGVHREGADKPRSDFESEHCGLAIGC